ncbi:MAG: hypothetical protein NVSMB1_16870 [Polyangiales bacterium]
MTATHAASVVTDHRRVLGLSESTTTLWDQVEYAGSPEGFAWVLPIRGRVVVGVGSDAFINALDNTTTPLIRAPSLICNGNSFGGSSGGGGGGGGACASSVSEQSASGGARPVSDGYQEDSGVFVTAHSVVGPYETVQVHGTDEGSIVGWLRGHNYVVPADIEPILTRYVQEGFDFVAVRLRPGVGVQAMRPIRVTFAGRYPSLPLRMVAAGVGDSVGIKLFVIGAGRWRVGNFPTFSIDPSTVTWDFAQQKSDYVIMRNKSAASFDGRAFALESSISVSRTSLPFEVSDDIPTPDAPDAQTDGASDGRADAAADAPHGTKEAGTFYDAGSVPDVSPTASDTVIAYGSHESRRITRLRADLPARVLDLDLALEADNAQSELPALVQLTKSKNVDAVCPTGAAPTPTPAAKSSNGCDCTVGDAQGSRPLRASIGLSIGALIGAVVRRAIRRRRGETRA